MERINIKEIAENPHNVRASPAEVSETAESIADPVSDITVNLVQTNSGIRYDIFDRPLETPSSDRRAW